MTSELTADEKFTMWQVGRAGARGMVEHESLCPETLEPLRKAGLLKRSGAVFGGTALRYWRLA